MNRNKKERALRLFQAIGELDDRLLQSAMLYRSPKPTPMLLRLLPLAATLAFCTVLILTVLILPSMLKGLLPPPNDSGKIDDPLSDTMYDLRDSGQMQPLANHKEALPFSDGSAYLVCQYTEDGGFYVSDPLSERDIEHLTASLGMGERVSPDADPIECRVWILLGNGDVLSPYLALSDGNVGKATLFDYEAELIPTEDFAKTVSGILNTPQS
ncbi:MAG: hypothetical protein E7666_08550 [Ruminococcaceae bacterium]|nr:hypothetical protein [Oscillospiraceae bacterium]